ncbi:MAG TPA: hypothetical protein VIU14_09685 [Mesorhizobium sp.]
MEGWVGPAIVAAVISGLVSLVLVQLNFRQSRRIEQIRRDEKIRDFQIALRAEIRAELLNLSHYDIEAQRSEVRRRYESDPSYSVSVPRPVRQAVFDALISEIHILPEAVIDPVVLFERQRNVVESLAEDMRDASFKMLSREQQLAMYDDYLMMWDTWRSFALNAEAVLNGDTSIAGSGTGLASDGFRAG